MGIIWTIIIGFVAGVIAKFVMPGFRRGNAVLWWVTAGTGAILSAVLAFEPTRQLFHFGPLHGDDVAVALAIGILVMIVLTLMKWREQRHFLKHAQSRNA